MTDQEQERPLTRRELRLREQAEAAAAAGLEEQNSEVQPEEQTEEPSADRNAAEELIAEIEISSFNDDGTPRSRREIRQLREAAIAELLGSVEAEEADFGTPTEAYSFDELREAESHAGVPTEALSLDELLAGDDTEAPAENSESIAALFGGEDVVEEEVVAEEADDAFDDSNNVDDAEDQVDSPVVEAEEEPEAEAETPTSSYSFPDIKPPEEWRSVFDGPSRIENTGDSSTGDFDDLISRAVAQEGSTGSSGVSALILPSHPESTGGLSGPLGATGELFVTGSIELPKALGETGGHSATHDSIEHDPFLTGDHTGSMTAPADAGPVPVSAMSAVSARRRPEIPVVAEPTRDKSKLPVVLALTGGGLLILLVGGAVYAVSQGMFG